jgi:hypothetical protein
MITFIYTIEHSRDLIREEIERLILESNFEVILTIENEQ